MSRSTPPDNEQFNKEKPIDSVSYIADSDGKIHLNTPDIIARLKGENPQLRDPSQDEAFAADRDTSKAQQTSR